MNNIQEIYINLDDSGKLSDKEQISVYGGLVFMSKPEKDKFITQYKSIIKDIKCKYCEHKTKCNNKCPEIKNTNIEPKDKRRIMNYIKMYYVIGFVINNDNVYSYIKVSKAAKGRYIDYALRRLIKEVIKNMIKVNSLNPNKPIKLIINIDEQTTKSNGYYTLREGLIEELKYGIVNYNYLTQIKPIIFANLDIVITYQDSGKSYVVQAADLLAGTIRRTTIESLKKDENVHEILSKFVDFQIILP